MNLEDGLSIEIVQWLNEMKRFGYENIFSEGLLIIPIAESFRDQDFEVKGDTDYYFLRSDDKGPGKRAQINYDFYAKKDNGSVGEILILEIKWLKSEIKKVGSNHPKKGSANYPRIITDFIKLAIPPPNLWKRLTVVVLDPNLPVSSHQWFLQLMGGNKLELRVEKCIEALIP